MRSELRGLKRSGLRKRAVEANVSVDALDEAEDSDTPKDAVIDLIVLSLAAAAAGVSGGGAAEAAHPVKKEKAPAPVAKKARSHTGTASVERPAPSMFAPASQQIAMPRKRTAQPLLLNGRHAMLSYQWDHQPRKCLPRTVSAMLCSTKNSCTFCLPSRHLLQSQLSRRLRSTSGNTESRRGW